MDVLGRMTGAGVEEDIDMAAAGAEATVDLYLTVHDVAGRGVVNPVLGGVSQVSRKRGEQAAPSDAPRHSSIIMVPSITQLLLKKLALSLDWGPNLSV